MTHDIDVLRAWLRVVLVIAAVCTTTVPILYSFSPWRSRPIGKMFMFQAVAFAVAMDLTTFLTYWKSIPILVAFWIDVLVMTLIAVATAALALLMWRMNHPKKKEGQEDG